MTDTTPASPRRNAFPRWLVPAAVILVLGIILYNFFVGAQRRMVEKDEVANEKWAAVESSYQRRADLIGNLVATVKGYADFEQETLTKVIEARSKATSITIDPSNTTPEQFAQFQQAQDGLSSALSRLLVTVERYPDLKANQNFLELQAELAGTENRINVARNDYNTAVKEYNTYIRRFPQSFLAGMYGFEKRTMFKAAEGSENAPKVEF
ncbi:MAG: LemA family protein [Chitinophagales bacterium]|nr:LemA family protein [Chitinophagales bacterium]MCB9020971.1 LemA family protein [Chitinophagales bacterium]HAE13903.1 LemA family protein [Bacteroidota bacterium]HAE34702.1 LemA family protein [Bacteroidota bacterium]HRX24122.1 LemA family protein [Chitinophagales bacterium]